MAFPAVVLALVGLVGRTSGRRCWSGFAFGAAFFFVNLVFTARYLGPVPWIALSMLEAVLTAVGAIPITLAYRWMPRVLPGRVGAAHRCCRCSSRACGRCASRSSGSWPYGGLPVGADRHHAGRTARSPHLASWVGVSGLTFLMVLLCAAAIEYVRARAVPARR